MFYAKKLCRLLIGSTLLMFLVSCAGLSINPPGPDTQTLLVLPIKLTNKTMSSKQGFYYKYKIENTDDRSKSLSVSLILPAKGDMTIVDSLPPGNYAVTQFSYHPVGTGVSFSGNNTQRRNDRFVLESGKVTILSQTLHVTMENETVGRMGTTYFDFRMEPTSSQREREARETIKALPNGDAWAFL